MRLCLRYNISSKHGLGYWEVVLIIYEHFTPQRYLPTEQWGLHYLRLRSRPFAARTCGCFLFCSSWILLRHSSTHHILSSSLSPGASISCITAICHSKVFSSITAMHGLYFLFLAVYAGLGTAFVHMSEQRMFHRSSSDFGNQHGNDYISLLGNIYYRHVSILVTPLNTTHFQKAIS